MIVFSTWWCNLDLVIDGPAVALALAQSLQLGENRAEYQFHVNVLGARVQQWMIIISKFPMNDKLFCLCVAWHAWTMLDYVRSFANLVLQIFEQCSFINHFCSLFCKAVLVCWTPLILRSILWGQARTSPEYTRNHQRVIQSILIFTWSCIAMA